MIGVRQYAQQEVNMRWRWMVWPTGYPKLPKTRTQGATHGSATINNVQLDLINEREIHVYKLQFQQRYVEEGKRETRWRFEPLRPSIQIEKDGSYNVTIEWNDVIEQIKRTDMEWCTACVFMRDKDYGLQQIQTIVPQQQQTIRQHITILEPVIQKYGDVIRQLKQLIAQQKTSSNTILQTINAIKQQMTQIQNTTNTLNLKIRKLPTTGSRPTGSSADYTRSMIDLQTKFQNLQQNIATTHTLLKTYMQEVNSTKKDLDTVKQGVIQNKQFITNYEPYLKRLIDAELNASHWTHVYNTTGAIMRQMTELSNTYNQYVARHSSPDEPKPESKSPLDMIKNVFSIFSSSLSVGKTVKDLTVDEYNSMA